MSIKQINDELARTKKHFDRAVDEGPLYVSEYWRGYRDALRVVRRGCSRKKKLKI